MRKSRISKIMMFLFFMSIVLGCNNSDSPSGISVKTPEVNGTVTFGSESPAWLVSGDAIFRTDIVLEETGTGQDILAVRIGIGSLETANTETGKWDIGIMATGNLEKSAGGIVFNKDFGAGDNLPTSSIIYSDEINAGFNGKRFQHENGLLEVKFEEGITSGTFSASVAESVDSDIVENGEHFDFSGSFTATNQVSIRCYALRASGSSDTDIVDSETDIVDTEYTPPATTLVSLDHPFCQKYL
jgi:hypothetical protein